MLKLEFQLSVINAYSIVVRDPARLMMTRLVMTIFGLSASLQRVLELRVKFQASLSKLTVESLSLSEAVRA